MRHIKIELCEANEEDKINIMELIHSSLIKLGISASTIKLSYGLTTKTNPEIKINLSGKVISLLKIHGTTTRVPETAPADTSNSP